MKKYRRTGKLSMFMGYQERLSPTNHPKSILIGATQYDIDILLYYSGRWTDIYCFESEQEMNEWYKEM